MHSLRSLANLIAEIDNLPDGGADLVHSQARNLVAKSLLHPVEAKRGRTSAGAYDDHQVARARVLLELVDSGYGSRDLLKVNEALDSRISIFGSDLPESVKVDGGWQPRPGLDAAIRGAGFGEDWRLRIERWKTPDGHFYLKSHVVWAGDIDAEEDERVRGIWKSATGDVCRKVDELRLTPLLAPVLA